MIEFIKALAGGLFFALCMILIIKYFGMDK